MSKITVSIKYRGVVGQLGDQRDEVLREFRESGGQKDRWSRPDWMKMARAIIAAEDRLELRLHKALSPGGLRLRAVRRQLEVD